MSNYCVYSSSPDSCTKRFCGTMEECEQWITDNKYRFPGYVTLKIQPAEESAKWERDFDIHSGGSVYEQLNKIDDNKSLDEKLKESFYDEDDYANDYEYEEWTWDGLKDDIDVNMCDVRLNGKKPFEYDTEVIDDNHIHIIIYIENDDGKTLTRYEADVTDKYSVPEYSSGVVDYIEDLPWKQTGIESIEESLTEDTETSNAVMRGIDKVIKDTRSIFEEASSTLEGGFVEYFDKYRKYLETQDIDEVKNSLDEFIRYINIKFIDRINFFKNQLEK